MQTHHLSIVEYFNAYREYLFDNESTINIWMRRKSWINFKI
jgi:hypothetical protein